MESESRKFLRRFIPFSIPVLIAFVAVEAGLRRVENTYTHKRRLLEQRMDATRVLVLGSSHANFGIAAGQFSVPAFNLAGVSQSLVVDEQLLRKYMDKMPNLRVVLISISYFSLFYKMSRMQEHWRNYFYFHFFGITGDSALSQWLDVRMLSVYQLYGQDLSKKFVAAGFQGNLSTGMDEYGWRGQGAFLPIVFRKEESKKRLAVQHGYMHDDLLSDNQQALQRMINRARDRHVHVALVTLPISPLYQAVVDPGRVQKMRSVVRQYVNNQDVTSHDYFDDPRFVERDFADSDHLYVDGAVKFSKILDAEAVRPALSAPQPPSQDAVAR